MATGLSVAGNGIALGVRSFAAIQTQYSLVPSTYTWLHEYRGPNPMPEHEAFDGQEFNGDYILQDGRNWYPGDHAGCSCESVPAFREVT